jgi:hypothetical protein
MSSLLEKLNWKSPERACVMEAPAEFVPALSEMNTLSHVDSHPAAGAGYDFVLAFCQQQGDVKRLFASVKEHLPADPVLWMAYPKKTSRRYASDISRDQGWQPLGDDGFEPVRQVAIDDDWSALRFRRAGNIKTLSRNPDMMLSEEAKARRKN